MHYLFPQFNERIFNIFNIESTVLKLNSNHIAIAYALTEVWKYFWRKGTTNIFFELVFIYVIWISCTDLVLSASWIHGLMAQLIRVSEQISVVVGSNSSQANFSYF